MKHLTYDERLQMQKAFTLKTSFAAIAQTLGKNRTTIAREVKTYARFTGKPARSKYKFTCIFEDRTKCPAPGCTKRVCSIACSKCAPSCDKFEPIICKKLSRSPYVCNGCADRSTCNLMKKMYQADAAQNVCEMDTVEGRKGGKVLLTIFFRDCRSRGCGQKPGHI